MLFLYLCYTLLQAVWKHITELLNKALKFIVDMDGSRTPAYQALLQEQIPIFQHACLDSAEYGRGVRENARIHRMYPGAGGELEDIFGPYEHEEGE